MTFDISYSDNPDDDLAGMYRRIKTSRRPRIQVQRELRRLMTGFVGRDFNPNEMLGEIAAAVKVMGIALTHRTHRTLRITDETTNQELSDFIRGRSMGDAG